MQAAILKVKINYLDIWTDRRIKIAERYSNSLTNVTVPSVTEGHVFHQYTVLSSRRDELKVYLSINGISSNIYYPRPLHLQECFENLGYKVGDFPISEEYA
ncbi:DegT/DnrJ/EryC1/StrS family aminotransferase, partial [Arthrospira platensis SPKY2]